MNFVIVISLLILTMQMFRKSFI